MVKGRVLVAGAGQGALLRLAAPISFWGGVDPVKGTVTDPRHPDFGCALAGRVLLVPSAVGSSSSSAIMLELLRNHVAPAAVLMGKADAILALGVVVGGELGYTTVPVVEVSMEEMKAVSSGTMVTVTDDGVVTSGGEGGGNGIVPLEGGTAPLWQSPGVFLLAVVALAVTVAGAAGQEIRGQVLDQSSGAPVPLAGVYLLDRDREVVSAALADEEGRYVLSVPEGGDYYLKVQRLGYFETESPLLEVSAGRDYDVELGVRPEPIRIEGLEVEVQAEKQNSWAKERLRFMDPRWGWGDPSAAFGFRVITGLRLEEAKLRAKDSLDLLRWVYVPIYNSAVGMCVQMRPNFNRGGGRRAMGIHDTPAPVPQCGNIYLDGMPLQPEHVESIDLRSITGVMVIPPTLHLMTVDFERRFRERPVR